MKNKSVVVLILLLVLCTSCAPSMYYQVYEVKPVDNKNNIGVNKYSYDDCVLTYNFWGKGGNTGFWLYNKSQEDIYIYMNESFYVVNEVAHDYYKHRSYTHSLSSEFGTKELGHSSFYNSLTTVSASSTSTNSISTSEAKIICIPSKSSKFIGEYFVVDGPYRDCELLRFPRRKRPSELSFSKEESPFVFGNKIRYRVGKAGVLKYIDNFFYVSKIENMHPKNIVDYPLEKFCNETSYSRVKTFKFSGSNMFYFNYNSSSDGLKH